MSSLKIRNWYRNAAPAYFSEFEEGERFWQPKYYSFEIYQEQKQKEKLDDMHQNPVRAGLVDHATKWSSARWDASRQTVGVTIQWVR